MPELPEVETIVRKLQAVVPGKVISQIQQFHPKTFHGQADRLLQAPIEAVSRRAKIIRFHFPHQLNILVHLKMTGQLIYLDDSQRLGGGHPTDDWVGQLPAKHTRVQWSFADGSKLFFNDQRLFGWMKLTTDDEVLAHYAPLGPDVIDPILSAEYLFTCCQRRRSPIKLVILDNQVMCGLGNIYACDALNLAQLHPLRPANTLSLPEVERLLEASRTVLIKAIELGGTTFDGKYVDLDGFAGQYQSVVRTYGREGKPCLHCGTPIEKIMLGGRGTYFCPNCQL